MIAVIRILMATPGVCLKIDRFSVPPVPSPAEPVGRVSGAETAG
jgi:hypothetical protein